MKRIYLILFLSMLVSLAGTVMLSADNRSDGQTILSPQQFLVNTFQDAVPKPKFLWIKKEMRADIDKILFHNRFRPLRVRYWQQGDQTVWILEDIGKYQPITAGFVIKANTLDTLKVLIYRESHGWEVKHDFFTNQFKGLTLRDDLNLSDRIDGISGATLSVNTLKNLARLALYFHEQTSRT